MLLINLQNIEELLFYNTEIKGMLPELSHIFDQWLISQRIPAMRSLKIQALLDLMNGLTEENIQLLSEYFGETVSIDKLDYKLTHHLSLPLDGQTKKLINLSGNFAVSRDCNQIYISFWK